MSKRFTDSQKWADPWFGDLAPNEKLFWMYLLDNCDHSGIWKIHLRLAEFHLGFKPSLKSFDSRIVYLNDEKIFIPGFLAFQYGEMNENNRVHKSVIDRLKKEGAYKALKRPSQRAKEKDKEKEKEKEKAKDKEKAKNKSQETEHARTREGFNIFWEQYPKRVGRAAAQKAWNVAKKNKKLPHIDAILSALDTQINSVQWKKDNGQYIPHPHRWIQQARWDDEVRVEGQGYLELIAEIENGHTE